MITKSPLPILRPSLMKSVPSDQDRGMGVPISWGFLTAAMATPKTPSCARSEFLLLSMARAIFVLPTDVAGADPAKAETPGTDGTVKACVCERPRSTRARIDTPAARLRRKDRAMLATDWLLHLALRAKSQSVGTFVSSALSQRKNFIKGVIDGPDPRANQ